MLGNVLKQFGGPKLASKATVYRDLMNDASWDEGEIFPAKPAVRLNRSTYMRVSAISYMCARLESIRISNGIVLRKEVDPESAYTFILGRHHHEMMQESVVPAILRNRMRGWWQKGDAHVGGLVDGKPEMLPPPDGDPGWKYQEMYAYSHDLLVHGHPDMVIDWTGSGLPGVPDAAEVQEYKSKDPISWAMIDPEQGGYPDKSHVIQTQMYMALLGLNYGRIVYVKKGERRLNETFIEWPLERDEGLLASIKTMIADFWVAIRDAHETGKWHETKLQQCSKFESGRALNCPLRYECHSRTWRKERTAIRPMTGEELSEHALDAIMSAP